MDFELPTETQGTGEHVVLVHGALGDRRQWTPIAALLAAGFRVHAFSRRYHWPAPAPAPDVAYSYESHRDDLLSMLAAIDGPVHVAGHSYGAGVALLAAITAPARLRSLTLVEPALGSLLPRDAPGLDDERASRLASVSQVRALLEARRDEEAARVFVDWLQGGPGGFSRLPDDERRTLIANAATLGPTLAAPQPDVTREALGALRVPTLVVNGEESRPWYRLIGDHVASGVPGAVHAVVAGCAHMTIVERPREIAALIDRFCRHAGAVP